MTPAKALAAINEMRTMLARGDLTEAEGRAMLRDLQPLVHAASRKAWEPYPWQIPPDQVTTHGAWLMLGGRGTGKTEAGSRYVDDHANGPPCDDRLPGGHRMAIVAPTLGDASESCVTGPSGIQTVNKHTILRGGRGGTNVIWPNGATARLFGAYSKEDSERLRAGGNRCLVWMEEVAAMRFIDNALDHTAFGLRIGSNPHYVMTTTPKPRPAIRTLVKSSTTSVTRGRTADAHHLDPSVRAMLFAKYEGTRLGRQELDAELLEDVEGALWSYRLIDDFRDRRPAYERVAIGVDPPGGTGPGAEAGIIVVGTIGDQGYVLADLSGSMSPDQWGQAAVKAYYHFGAEAIVVETTYGGEMVVSTIRTIDTRVPLLRAPTKVGKKLRAEPVVAIYEQHRMHHADIFGDLEAQMTSWVPDEGLSPDRVDALVHVVTHLMIRAAQAIVSNPARDPRRLDQQGLPPGLAGALPPGLPPGMGGVPGMGRLPGM